MRGERLALLIEERQKRSLGGLIRAPIAAIWLAVIMLAGISILGALMIWQSYNAAIELSEARAKSSAQVVAAHMEWLMEASDQARRRLRPSGWIPVFRLRRDRAAANVEHGGSDWHRRFRSRVLPAPSRRGRLFHLSAARGAAERRASFRRRPAHLTRWRVSRSGQHCDPHADHG